jgi:uncharacterized protein (DUF1778 family)
MIIPRQALKLPKTDAHTKQEDQTPVSISNLREQHAWVLLGEPGAGKSTTFQEEAQACGGMFIPLVEFIHADNNNREDWKNKTLFLDGLDEVKDDLQNTLLTIKIRLEKLDHPRFRLSCRAADWKGEWCLEQLKGTTPAQENIAVYTLCPLSEEETTTLATHLIAQNQHSNDQSTIHNAEEFLRCIQQNQLNDFAGHPQTLEWLLKLQPQDWSSSRQDLLEKTCKRLAEEHNRTHRERTKTLGTSTPNTDDTLTAAGQLFASLLLGNQQGVALDQDSTTAGYPELKTYQPHNQAACEHALKTQLFKPATNAQERLEPAHRSIAEYLGACWLAKQLKNNTLAFSRLKRLLTGQDGECFSGLRGLYTWLASKSISARGQLIQQDPITVIMYGNANTLGNERTKQLLDHIKQNLATDTTLYGRLLRSKNLHNLYHPELQNDYLAWLQEEQLTQAHEFWIRILLDILKNHSIQPELTQRLLEIVQDERYTDETRCEALDAWLSTNPPIHNIQSLLQALHIQKITDKNQRLLGTALCTVYPKHLSTQDVLPYFNRLDYDQMGYPVDGSFQLFWGYIFIKELPSQDLRSTLETLGIWTQNEINKFISYDQHRLTDMLSKLLARAITELGDKITDAELLDWLMIGVDQHGTNHLKDTRHREEHTHIAEWMNTRPTRYKGVLFEGYQHAALHADPIHQVYLYEKALAGFSPPADLTEWHWQQVDQTSSLELKKKHLHKAVSALLQGNAGSLTLEQLEQWAANDIQKQAMLEPLLQEQIKESRYVYWKDKQESNNTIKIEREKRSEELKQSLHSIEQGSAAPHIMSFFAQLWNGRTLYYGKTPEERLHSYCKQPDTLKHTIEQGMPKCLEREDLPTHEKIIQLYIKNEYHHLRPACLLGAAFLEKNNLNRILSLPETTLKILVCFQFTAPADSQNMPSWFLQLIQQQGSLVDEVFIALAKASLRTKPEHIPYLHPLLLITKTNPERTKHIVLSLLKDFPLRATTNQIEQLKKLLYTALEQPDQEGVFADLISEKLQKKSLDTTQKTLWLSAGLTLVPVQYETTLIDHLKHAKHQLASVHAFCFNSFDGFKLNIADWPIRFLGQLIEHATPHVPERRFWTSGTTLDWHDFTRALIHHLAQRNTPESITELERLADQSPQATQFMLQNALNEAKQRLRDQAFAQLSLNQIASILNNKTPVNAADLHALALACLEDIADNIRTSNSDIYRQFWNEKPEKTHKDENSCRDALLELLRIKLKPHQVDCQPEADYIHDKRADIKLSVGPNISIPIEVKGEWNDELWTAIKNQLIPKYTQEKCSNGFGIYVVLWVGGDQQQKCLDGGKKPKTAQDLETRLRQHSIPAEHQHSIEVRVLDVSWPNTTKR